jgi:hypothetical protein
VPRLGEATIRFMERAAACAVPGAGPPWSSRTQSRRCRLAIPLFLVLAKIQADPQQTLRYGSGLGRTAKDSHVALAKRDGLFLSGVSTASNLLRRYLNRGPEAGEDDE